MRNAVITGITGQDGAYLAELLLGKGYKVYGVHRHTTSSNFWRLRELGIVDHPNLHMVEYDQTNLESVMRLIEQTQPDEVYNLASQSSVSASFDQPHTTSQINAVGALNLLEAIRMINSSIRFYQASTCEMFGKVREIPQSEETPCYPRSPYATAKLYAHWATINYRESYDIFGASGILFNHESPLRGKEFVTRKITDGLAQIKLGKKKFLELGNLNAQRDWGYAKDYVEGMHRMLQVEMPGTYVLATNRTKTVRDFVTLSCKSAEIEVEWRGSGEEELGIDLSTGREIIRVNPQFYRPCEVELLIGDPQKANDELGWEPHTSLEDLCAMMVYADLRRHEGGVLC